MADITDNTPMLTAEDAHPHDAATGSGSEAGEFLVCAYCGSREISETVTTEGLVHAVVCADGYGHKTIPLEEPNTESLDYRCESCGRWLDGNTLITETERAQRSDLVSSTPGTTKRR